VPDHKSWTPNSGLTYHKITSSNSRTLGAGTIPLWLIDHSLADKQSISQSPVLASNLPSITMNNIRQIQELNKRELENGA
jgi:hypothetical protein